MFYKVKNVLKEGYELLKPDIPVFIYAVILVKLSMRWIDSPLGYIFFPLMLLAVLKMDLQQRLYVLIFLLPFSESKQLPRSLFGIMGFNFTNFIFLLLIFPMLFFRKGRRVQRSSFNVGIVLFVLMIFISCVRGMEAMPYLGISNTLVYFMESFLKPMQIFLCGIIAFNLCRKPEELNRFLRAVKVAGIIFGIWILFRSAGTIESMGRLARLTGIHKNSIGFMFASLLAMSLGTESFGKISERILTRILIGVSILVVLFTFSRQGYVTCLILITIYFFRKGFKGVVLLVVGGLLFWNFFMPFEVKKRIFHGTETGVKMGLKEYTLGDTTSGREETWQQSMEVVYRNPLFGQGRFAYLKNIRAVNPNLPVHPHNAYIQSLLDGGVFGSIFIVGFYLFLLKKSWFLYKTSKSKFASAYSYGFFLCILAFLLQAYTGFRFYPNEESYYIWIFLGGLMWIDSNQMQLLEEET